MQKCYQPICVGTCMSKLLCIRQVNACPGRMCMLYQVKRACSEQKAPILKIYLSLIRPVLEYACPVWHPHLHVRKYLSDGIECIQKRALRCIYLGRLYEDLLSDMHISSFCVLRIPSSHEVQANFKANFSNCEFSQSHVYVSFLYFTVWYVAFTVFIIILSMSIQPYSCRDKCNLILI